MRRFDPELIFISAGFDGHKYVFRRGCAGVGQTDDSRLHAQFGECGQLFVPSVYFVAEMIS